MFNPLWKVYVNVHLSRENMEKLGILVHQLLLTASFQKSIQRYVFFVENPTVSP